MKNRYQEVLELIQAEKALIAQVYRHSEGKEQYFNGCLDETSRLYDLIELMGREEEK